MSYTITPKPAAVDYLKRQQGDYLLLEGGGRIIIRRASTRVTKPTGVWTPVAKPAIP